MMNPIEGTRLSKMYDIKIACWDGCNIRQMRGKLAPILENESYDYIINNVGTTDNENVGRDVGTNDNENVGRDVG